MDRSDHITHRQASRRSLSELAERLGQDGHRRYRPNRAWRPRRELATPSPLRGNVLSRTTSTKVRGNGDGAEATAALLCCVDLRAALSRSKGAATAGRRRSRIQREHPPWQSRRSTAAGRFQPGDWCAAGAGCQATARLRWHGCRRRRPHPAPVVCRYRKRLNHSSDSIPPAASSRSAVAVKATVISWCCLTKPILDPRSS